MQQYSVKHVKTSVLLGCALTFFVSILDPLPDAGFFVTRNAVLNELKEVQVRFSNAEASLLNRDARQYTPDDSL